MLELQHHLTCNGIFLSCGHKVCCLYSAYGDKDQVVGEIEMQRNSESTILSLPLSLV